MQLVEARQNCEHMVFRGHRYVEKMTATSWHHPNLRSGIWVKVPACLLRNTWASTQCSARLFVTRSQQ